MKKIKKIMISLLAVNFIFVATMSACNAKNPQNSLPQEPTQSESSTDQPSEEENLPPIETEKPGNTTDSSTNGSANSSTNNGSTVEKPQPSEPSQKPTPTPTPTVSYAKYIRCEGNNVNIRKGAGTNYVVLGQAEKNTPYTVLEEKNGWYKTYYRNQEAYISASYVKVFTLQKTDEQVEKVIGEGYKLLGVPYVYGAVRLHNGKGKMLAEFSVQKFDCSSLMQYIFYKGAGVLLDVTTRTQVKQGEYVNPNDLQRGDCIFFTNEERQYNTGIERVGHVALYLGNNYILHTASDYARIEQISNKRWSYYIEARRFV